MSLAACSGGGLEALPSSMSGPGERPADGEVEAPPAPIGDPPAEPQPDVLEPPAHIESDACRFLILRDDGEVQIAWASGETRALARDDAWAQATGSDVAAVGQYAMVGVASPDFRGDPTVLFVHPERGVLYEGTQPNPTDYTRAMGFLSITREGFAVLNDGSVLDAGGSQHQAPEAGFFPVVPNIDEHGYVLVGRSAELAYWDVTGDRIDRAPTEGLGEALVSPFALGGIEGHEVAFVEDRGSGSMAFARLSREGALRAALSPAAAQLVQAELDRGELRELYISDHGEQSGAALLVAGHRPLAWVRPGHAPLALDRGAELPPARFVRGSGGCFTGTSAAAITADQIIATTWRVNAEDGAFEMGLRFPIPSGLALDVPIPSAYPLPICVGEGRMAVLLRGPSGYAWFEEGDSSFEQLTLWTPEQPGEPAEAFELIERPHSERRAVAPWHRISIPERCEHRHEGTGTTLIDHELGLEHFVAATGYAAVHWLESSDPAL